MRATQDVLKNTKGIECVLNAGCSEKIRKRKEQRVFRFELERQRGG
ncbi:Uncharacterised protein [Streptococcus suis]|uniref:Uncharacterized protein n=1 Tax=Streptococcus suis TaxID=1307 RepID=A0A116RFY0_STRSU|nr:hypothetical protein SSU16085_01928 [Streptococcus suis]CYV42502.1 Uncharacterised protein [Streptococcus suis]CYV44457.1 Uncharacterised protein [Streptococcus suis]CYW75715.1 Uncharacterised protein [Streptococcus suis]CYW93070.1 Uncharacterised protein [Streptococcus suis]